MPPSSPPPKDPSPRFTFKDGWEAILKVHARKNPWATTWSLSERNLYFVGDAVSGEPVAGANLEFFGYRQEHLGAATTSLLRPIPDSGSPIPKRLTPRPLAYHPDEHRSAHGAADLPQARFSGEARQNLPGA
jgi:hypothetical protein